MTASGRVRLQRALGSVQNGRGSATQRRGAATLDYVLVLGVILPLAAFVMWIGPRIMNLVYEMLSLFVSWPFL